MFQLFRINGYRINRSEKIKASESDYVCRSQIGRCARYSQLMKDRMKIYKNRLKAVLSLGNVSLILSK